MRTAPSDPNRRRSKHDTYNDVDPSSSDFAPRQSSSTHFQILDDEGLVVEKQRIDEAARRLLDRRRTGPSKAWGAPAKTSEDYRRSLGVMSPRNRMERAEHNSPKQRRRKGLSKEDNEALNYAFVAESEREREREGESGGGGGGGGGSRSHNRTAAQRPHTAGARGGSGGGGGGGERKRNSGLEEIPSDFVDKLHLMRGNTVAKADDLEEQYEDERTSPKNHGGSGASGSGPKSPVKSWTNAVREAFVEERETGGGGGGGGGGGARGGGETKRRTRKKVVVVGRKKGNTISQPFAGVEARTTIKTISRSMERTLEDLAKKGKKLFLYFTIIYVLLNIIFYMLTFIEKLI